MSGVERIEVKHIGAYVTYRGVLLKIIGIGDGLNVIMEPVDPTDFPHCTNCGHVQPREQGRVQLLWDSPLFQESVKGVPTVKWSEP